MADDLISPNAPDDESHKQAADKGSSAKGSSYPVKEVAAPDRDGGVESNSIWLWGLFDAGIILLFWGWSEFFGSHNSPILSNVFFFGFVSSVFVAIAFFTFKHWPHLIIISLSCVLLCGVSGMVIYEFSKPPKPLPTNATESKRVPPAVETNAVGWLPPELPPGCSNVTVSFGTSRRETPIWLAKVPLREPDTNGLGTNFFKTQITSNLSATAYVHFADIGTTDKDAIVYPIKELPSDFVSNEAQLPDYSPRYRHAALHSRSWQLWVPSGKTGGVLIDDPIFPIVVSNRLFVEVKIPFINERHRILMDTKGDKELSKIPLKWDINYNSNKFEVVNEDKYPVLQVIYKSPSEVRVNGIYIVNRFYVYEAFDASPLLFTLQASFWDGQTMQKMEIKDFENNFPGAAPAVNTNLIYRIKFPKQKAIFKYPSAIHLGELNN